MSGFSYQFKYNSDTYAIDTLIPNNKLLWNEVNAMLADQNKDISAISNCWIIYNKAIDEHRHRRFLFEHQHNCSPEIRSSTWLEHIMYDFVLGDDFNTVYLQLPDDVLFTHTCLIVELISCELLVGRYGSTNPEYEPSKFYGWVESRDSDKSKLHDTFYSAIKHFKLMVAMVNDANIWTEPKPELKPSPNLVITPTRTRKFSAVIPHSDHYLNQMINSWKRSNPILNQVQIQVSRYCSDLNFLEVHGDINNPNLSDEEIRNELIKFFSWLDSSLTQDGIRFTFYGYTANVDIEIYRAS